MSQNLFGSVTRPVSRVGSASRGTLGVSLVAHAAAVALVVAVPLAAPSVMPDPRGVVPAFVPAAPIPPVPPSPAPTRPPSAQVAAATSAVPVVAPDRIRDEVPFVVPGAPPVTAGISCGPVTEVSRCAGGVIGSIGFTPGPVPPPSAPVRIGGYFRAPEKIVHVNPAYPPLARTTRTEGTVILDAIIAPDGTIRDLRTLRSHPLLEAAAVDAVRQWRYRPTLLNGVPIAVVMTVTVTFRLQ